MTEERKIQLGVSVDATEARQGLAGVKDAAHDMAQSVAAAGTQAGKGVEAIGKGGDVAARTLDGSTKSIISSIQRATAAMEAGQRGTAAYFEAIAKQRNANLDALTPYLNQLKAAEVAQRAATGSLNTMGISAAQTAAAMRMVPAQFTDIVTSLQAGQAPMTVLLQQGGQLKDMFGGTGAAAKALASYVAGLINPFTVAAAAVAGFGVAYYQGAQEAKELQKALILSGNAAATTANQLSEMAAKVSASTGVTRNAAAETAASLAGAGKVASENMAVAMEASLRMTKVGASSVKDMTAAFADLGHAPVEATLKLNDQFNYLTISTYKQIKALEDQGRTQDAAAVAQKAFADATINTAKQLEANLGTLDRAWLKISGSAKSAWDAMRGVGREPTVLERMAAIQKELNRIDSDDQAGSKNSKDKAKERLRAELLGLAERAEGEKAVTAIKDDQQKRVERELNIEKELEKSQLRKIKNDHDRLDLLKSAPDSPEKRDRERMLRKEIEDTQRARGEDAYQLEVGRIRDQLARQEELYKGYYKDIEALQKSGDMTERDALEAKYAVDELKLEKELQAAQKMVEASRGRTIQEKAEAQKQLDIIRERWSTQTRIEEEGRAVLDEKQRKFNEQLDALLAKDLDPVTKAIADFNKQFGKELNDAVKDAQSGVAGAQEVVDKLQRIRQNAISGGEFELAKKQYELLFSQLQEGLEAVRDAAQRDGGIFAQIDAAKKSEEIKNKLLPQLEAARDKMQEFASGNPVNEKTVTDATRNIKKITAEADSYWLNLGRSAESYLTGALDRSFENGHFNSKKFIQQLKDDLAKTAFTITIQGAIGQIFGGAGGLGGALSSVLGGGSSSTGGLLNLASAGNSVYGLAKGESLLSSLFSSGSGGGAGQALTNLAIGNPTTVSSLAGAGGGAGEALTALTQGSSGLLSGISTALPWVGGALAIASLLGGDLFGSGGSPKHNAGTAFTGTASGSTAKDLQSLLGWSDGYSGQFDLQKAIYTDSVKAIVAKYAPTSAYDVMLGAHINDKGRSSNQYDSKITNAAGQTVYDHGPDSGKGTSDWETYAKEEIPRLQVAMIADAFRSANDDYKAIADSILGTSTDLTSAISGLSADAANAVQANLAGLASLFDQIKTTINGSITGELTVALANAAGGFSNLSTEISSYYAAYFSEEEKLSKSYGQLSDQFSALNVQMPASKEGFRKLVESLDLTTNSGQSTFAMLMQVAPAFDQVTQAIDKIVSQKNSLIARVAGSSNTTPTLSDINSIITSYGYNPLSSMMSRDQALAELKGVDATNPGNATFFKMADEVLPLMEQVWNATATTATTAATTASTAWDSVSTSATSAADAAKEAQAAAKSAVDAAFSALQKAVDAERDRLNTVYTGQADALDAQWKTTQAALEAQKAAASDNLNAIRKIAGALKSSTESVQVETDQSLRNRRAGAFGALNNALSASNAGASLAGFTGIEDALAVVAKPSAQLYGSFIEYAREQGRVAATIAGLSKNADAQVSVAEMTLNAINAAASAAQADYDSQKKQLARQHEEDLKALDDILANGQAQIDALNGVSTAVLTIGQALSGLATAIAMAQSAGAGGGGGGGSGGNVGSGGSTSGGGYSYGGKSVSNDIAADWNAFNASDATKQKLLDYFGTYMSASTADEMWSSKNVYEHFYGNDVFTDEKLRSLGLNPEYVRADYRNNMATEYGGSTGFLRFMQDYGYLSGGQLVSQTELRQSRAAGLSLDDQAIIDGILRTGQFGSTRNFSYAELSAKLGADYSGSTLIKEVANLLGTSPDRMAQLFSQNWLGERSFINDTSAADAAAAAAAALQAEQERVQYIAMGLDPAVMMTKPDATGRYPGDLAAAEWQQQIDAMVAAAEEERRRQAEQLAALSAATQAAASAYYYVDPSLLIAGSHASGLERVPYDGYLAETHADEAIVDAQSATAIRRYFGGSTKSDAALIKVMQAVQQEIKLLRAEARATTVNTRKTAITLDRVMQDDALAVRATA